MPGEPEIDFVTALRYTAWSNGMQDCGMQPGSFYGALFEALRQADAHNLNKLYKVFPNSVSAWLIWQQHGPSAVRSNINTIERAMRTD